jgi:hypothetical protein
MQIDLQVFDPLIGKSTNRFRDLMRVARHRFGRAEFSTQQSSPNGECSAKRRRVSIMPDTGLIHCGAHWRNNVWVTAPICYPAVPEIGILRADPENSRSPHTRTDQHRVRVCRELRGRNEQSRADKNSPSKSTYPSRRSGTMICSASSNRLTLRSHS